MYDASTSYANDVIVVLKAPHLRGGSAGIRILYTHVTSSGDIRYNNRSYAVVVQRKSCARQQSSAPSVPSCVCANDLVLQDVCISGGEGSTTAVESAATAPVVM